VTKDGPLDAQKAPENLIQGERKGERPNEIRTETQGINRSSRTPRTIVQARSAGEVILAKNGGFEGLQRGKKGVGDKEKPKMTRERKGAMVENTSNRHDANPRNGAPQRMLTLYYRIEKKKVNEGGGRKKRGEVGGGERQKGEEKRESC